MNPGWSDANLRFVDGAVNIVEFEGVVCVIERLKEDVRLEPGSLYLARRNGPWKLLTCRYDNISQWFVVPQEAEYPFDRNECFKIVKMDGVDV